MEKGRVDRHLASGLPYDMTTTVTTGEGQVRVFVAVDHCTCECVGLHAAKARQPLRGVGAAPPGRARALRRLRARGSPRGWRSATTTAAPT